MGQRLFVEEARQCRRWAEELAGKPDGSMLLRIAHAFDALAVERGADAGWDPAGRREPREERRQA